MRDHIITGYDGSEVSTAAAKWAADEALRRHVGLTVVGCYSSPSATDSGGGSFLSAADGALRDTTQALVDELAAELSRSHPGLAVDARAVAGRPHRQLVEQAAEADVVVIGSTGASRTPGSLMGSVTRAVVRNSPCPVVVVPAEHTMAERPRVVVAVDGSVRSEASLEWAIDETDLVGGQLLVVHAFSYPYGDGGETLSSARDLMRVDAARRLDQAVERARARGGAEVDGRLAEGRPGAEIVTSADGADLIVVGTRQRSAALHVAVLASVAEAVISHAPCPVAVVREGLIAPTP